VSIREDLCQKLSPNKATKEQGGIDIKQEEISIFPKKSEKGR
jgi:hypothetical protein